MKKSTTIIIALVGILVLGLMIAGGLFIRSKLTKVIQTAKVVTDSTKSDNNKSDGTPSKLKPACDYLTSADAEELLGQKVTQNDTKDTTSCFYATDISTGTFGLVSFIVANTSTNNNAESFNLAKTLAYNNQTEAITVAGADSAYWVPKANQVNVLKNNNWLIFSVITGSDEKVYKTLSIKEAEMVMKKL